MANRRSSTRIAFLAMSALLCLPGTPSSADGYGVTSVTDVAGNLNGTNLNGFGGGLGTVGGTNLGNLSIGGVSSGGKIGGDKGFTGGQGGAAFFGGGSAGGNNFGNSFGGVDSFNGAGNGSFNGGNLAGRFIIPQTVTPVDQNQLNGAGLVRQVEAFQTIPLPGTEADPALRELGMMLKGLPVDLGNLEGSQFGQITAGLYTAAGVPQPQTNNEPFSVLSTTGSSSVDIPEFHSGADMTLTIQYQPTMDGAPPNLVFFDPNSAQYRPVTGSTLQPNSIRIDNAHGIIEVSLDGTSYPSTSLLSGSLPKPRLTASLPWEFNPGQQFIAVANDASPSPLPGYLARETSHNEVVVVNREMSGYYYSSAPSALPTSALSRGLATVCDGGALIAERPGNVSVLNGRVLFASGSDPFSLRAPGSKIQMPAGASILMEYNQSTSAAKLSLVAQKNDEAAVLDTSIGRPIYLKAGRSITVYQQLPLLNRLKLVPAAASAQADVPLKAMLSKLEPFNADDMRKSGASEKFCRAVDRAIDSPSSEPERIARGGLSPYGTVRVLAGPQTIFSVDRNQVALQAGDLFMHTTHQVVLKTDVAELNAKSQADVVVSYQPGRERVDVLSGPGHVNMVMGDKNCQLSPGQEMVATTQGLCQKLVMPRDGVARRQFTTLKSGNTDICTCDFAIVALLKNRPLLQYLTHPSNPMDQLLKERLLKTACAVNYATIGRGKYISR